MNKLPLRDCVIGVDTSIPTTKGCVPRVFFNNSATNLVVKPVKRKLDEILPIYTYIETTNFYSDKLTEMYRDVREIITMDDVCL